MRFRTEFEPKPSSIRISHTDSILLLGSCFTDHIGTRLAVRGFKVMANPFGPFFNPESIRAIVEHRPTLFVEREGRVHCLDLPSRYQSAADARTALEQRIDSEYSLFSEFLCRADVAIITLGSANVYTHVQSGLIVANCHKLPASEFDFSRLSLECAAESLRGIVRRLNECGVGKVIFTISPVHHLDRGLEGNFVSKATLRLAVESVLSDIVVYFPSFEIMNDDLRDYRFYASDMKHPSEVAVDYIYSKFEETFFSKETIAEALIDYKKWQQSQHRTIISE